jgi:hypothetical protein
MHQQLKEEIGKRNGELPKQISDAKFNDKRVCYSLSRS